jgi:methyltransferase-like protein/2-polyprenyl-3-methyl-5-hydroxy-6-metoxy-1,4-benzoquinol methylase
MQLSSTESDEFLESTTPHTAYDDVPYLSYPYNQSHPNRLAVIATLFGMKPANVEHCRVLEMGCASGGNLIPLAAEFPRSSFLGVDLSSRQVADATKTIKTLGLENIEFRAASITDIDPSWGNFDYIICHGVYSWVPQAVREAIFDVCARQLNPHGIAYISYNTYPGWHMRGTVRELMVFHVRKWNTPGERVGQARAFLDFLVKIVPENDAYSYLLRGEVERLRNTADSYLLHEHLETVNDPVLFYDFAQAAAAKKLQFVAEAQSGARYLEALGGGADEMVRRLSRDVIEYEQYLDFLRNRMFRRSLMCHADVQLDRNLDPKRLESFYVASPAIVEGSVDPTSTEEARFRIEGGALTTGAPIVKASMSLLAERWPEAVSFQDLVNETEARISQVVTVPRADLAVALATNLAHSFIRQVVALYVSPPKVRTVAGEFPRASALARLQAAAQPHITTQLHSSASLNDFARKIIMLADGSRSRDDIFSALRQAVQNRELVMVDESGQPQATLPVDQTLQTALDKCLSELARMAFWC